MNRTAEDLVITSKIYLILGILLFLFLLWFIYAKIGGGILGNS